MPRHCLCLSTSLLYLPTYLPTLPYLGTPDHSLDEEPKERFAFSARKQQTMAMSDFKAHLQWHQRLREGKTSEGLAQPIPNCPVCLYKTRQDWSRRLQFDPARAWCRCLIQRQLNWCFGFFFFPFPSSNPSLSAWHLKPFNKPPHGKGWLDPREQAWNELPPPPAELTQVALLTCNRAELELRFFISADRNSSSIPKPGPTCSEVR